MAALVQLPTCLHALAYARALDPSCLAGCSPELTSHMPPIDFCNRMDPRAHLANIRTQRVVLAKRHPHGNSSPRREEPAEQLRTRGRPTTDRRIDSRMATARPTDLPSFESTRTPLVAMLTPSSTGWSTAAICGSDPSRRRTSSPWHARPRPGHDRGRVPLGPPSTVPRERNDGQPHPGCLPPIPSSLRCAEAPLLRGVAAQPAGFPVSAEPDHATLFLPNRAGS